MGGERGDSVTRGGALIMVALCATFVTMAAVLVVTVRQDREDLTRYCKPRGYIGARIDKFAGYLCIDASGHEVQITDPLWRTKNRR